MRCDDYEQYFPICKWSCTKIGHAFVDELHLIDSKSVIVA